MRRRLLARRPSPAMVVAVVALISSLTGGAVAATLITSADIKKNAVKSKHIKNGGVKGKDITRNAVKGGHVKDGSLLQEDFAAGEFPGTGPQGLQGEKGDKGETGDKGDKGDTGATGAAGATNVVVRRANVSVPASGFVQAGIGCEEGERATGGGFSTGLDSAYAVRSNPSDDGGTGSAQNGEVPNGWNIRIRNDGAGATTGTITVICASP